MIKNYLSIILRRLKVFLTRQPEKVEVRNGVPVEAAIKTLEQDVEELYDALQDADREYHKHINMLSTTITNLTQALAHTNVHFKTIKIDNKESK